MGLLDKNLRKIDVLVLTKHAHKLRIASQRLFERGQVELGELVMMRASGTCGFSFAGAVHVKKGQTVRSRHQSKRIAARMRFISTSSAISMKQWE